MTGGGWIFSCLGGLHAVVYESGRGNGDDVYRYFYDGGWWVSLIVSMMVGCGSVFWQRRGSGRRRWELVRDGCGAKLACSLAVVLVTLTRNVSPLVFHVLFFFSVFGIGGSLANRLRDDDVRRKMRWSDGFDWTSFHNSI